VRLIAKKRLIVSNQAEEQVVGERSPKRRLRLGLVGCGEVTQIMHWPSLYQLSDHFEVTALCDVSPLILEELGKLWNVGTLTTNHRELMAHNDVDAILVANPNAFHAEVTLDAIAAGKHVLVEKPMCVTRREADEIIAAQKNSTLNGSDTWPDVLSWRLHSAYGNKIAVVKEAISGNTVTTCPREGGTSVNGPSAADRLDRDVFGVAGLRYVVWLEGINDLGACLVSADQVIQGYKDVSCAAACQKYQGHRRNARVEFRQSDCELWVSKNRC
jgi:hypothetical protein